MRSIASLDPFWFIVRRLRTSRFFPVVYLNLLTKFLRGCFGLQTASEAKSDLANNFFMAKTPSYHFLGVGVLALFKLVGWDGEEESCKM